MTPAECPNCRRKLKVPPGKPDRVLTCPVCGTRFQLQVTASARPLPPAEPLVPLTPAGSGSGPLPLPPSQIPTAPPVASPLARPVAARPPEDDEPEPPIPQQRRRGDDSRSSRRRDDPPARSGGGGGKLVLIGGVCVLLALIAVGVVAFTFFKKKEEAAKEGPKPLGRYGAIEVGAKGVKAVAADFYAGDDGYEFDLKFEKTNNVGLGKLPAGGQEFAPAALTDTSAAVKELFETFTRDQGLTADRIWVVASSGVFSEFKTDAARDRGRAELAKRVMQAVGKEMDAVDVRDEARYEVLTCVPVRERPQTLLVDIGSGNTKGGYLEADGTFKALALNQGTSSYTTAVADNAAKPPAQRRTPAQLRDALLAKPLREDTDRVPGLTTKPKVVLTGGIVWATATFTHPSDVGKLRVPMTAADIDQFRGLLAKPDPAQVQKDLDQVRAKNVAAAPPADSAALDAEYGKVFDAFKPAQLQGGGEVLGAVSEEYRFAEKQVTFFSKGQFAWLMGYLADKSGVEKAARK